MNDLIKREDATETFAELYDIFDDYPNIVKELHKVYDKILAIPSAENKGEWIPYEAPLNFGNGEYYVTEHKCSACGYLWGEPDYKYCPECGAKMKGADNE